MEALKFLNTIYIFDKNILNQMRMIKTTYQKETSNNI